MTSMRITRRTLTATAGGFAAGIFAAPLLGAAAQTEATPGAVPVTPVPEGFVSTRLRTVADPASLDEITEQVRASFAPEVRALDGYQGYLVGQVVERDDQQVTVVVLEDESQIAAFEELAADFVASVGDVAGTVDTEQWAGELLISGSPAAPAATPIGASNEGFVAVRVHTSTPGTDPRDFVPLATSDFLPIVAGLPGFRGYLWYPIDGGFVAISVFDSAESAAASNDAAREWATEFLTEYTDGNPRVIDANIVYADMPIFHRS